MACPAAVFGFSYHYSSGGSSTARGGILAGISAGSPTSPAAKDITPFPVARIADALANPGKTIDYNGTKVTYPDIKMVYVAGGNTFHQHQDTNNPVKAPAASGNRGGERTVLDGDGETRGHRTAGDHHLRA